MSDNQIDNSSNIVKIIEEIREIKRNMKDTERTLQEIRNNTSALSEIKDYLYEMKNK